MATLVLIGPQLAGKTTFLNSAKNEKTEDNNPPTRKTQDTFWRGVKIGGVSGRITDTNGSMTAVLNNKSVLSDLISDNDYVAFMFNGKEFLQEVSKPENAGEISNIIKNLLLPTWESLFEKGKQLFFIANVSHNPTKKSFYIEGNARERILSAMKKANEEYSNLAKNMRYPFINYFESNNFYCIDATNFKEVQDAGNVMLK